MKKHAIVNKLAKLTLKAAVAGSNTPSMNDWHQPVVPKALKELKENKVSK